MALAAAAIPARGSAGTGRAGSMVVLLRAKPAQAAARSVCPAT